MADNPYVNKVETADGDTLIDLTSDTATAGDVIEGKTLHLSSGAPVTGTLGDATQSTHGLMSAADKAKLDGIEANANNYSLPTMGSSTKGGAKVGYGLSMDGEALNLGPLTDSGSGASVATDGCGIFGVHGEGWAEQDTTTGKNLLPNNLVSQTVSGVTFTRLADGGIRIQGTTNARNSGLMIANAFPLAAGTYTVSLGGGTINSPMRIAIDSVTTQVDVVQSLRSGSVTFTVSSAGTFRMYITDAYSSSSTQNTVIYPQIELGSTATAYEPYTGGKASPNPDYPQEIRVARGRNLVDQSTLGNVAYDVNGNRLPGSRYIGTLDFITCEPSMQYCFSYVSNKDINDAIVLFWQSDGTYIGGLRVLNNPLFTPPANAAKMKAYFQASSASGDELVIGVDLMQIERSSTPHPYVPYGYVGLEVGSPVSLYKSGYALNESGVEVQNADFNIMRSFVTPGTIAVSWYMYGDNRTTRVHALDANGNWISQIGLHDPRAASGLQSVICEVPANAVEVRIQYNVANPGHTGLRVYTTTPIPLPAKGFAGAIGNYIDKLTIDSAGGVKWDCRTGEEVFDGSSDEAWTTGATDTSGYYRLFTTKIEGKLVLPASNDATAVILSTTHTAISASDSWFRNTGVCINIPEGRVMLYDPSYQSASAWTTYLASSPMTILYALATPTTESGYINLPELPKGATVSIPELEAIGVEWWVAGTEAMAEHGRDVSRANKEQEDRIAELEAAVANLATS